MHEVENGYYETVIPKQDWGNEVEFYIETYDVLGNKAQSESEFYIVAEEEFNVLLLIIIIIIILMIVVFVKIVINSRKIKKYMNQKTSVRIKEAK